MEGVFTFKIKWLKSFKCLTNFLHKNKDTQEKVNRNSMNSKEQIEFLFDQEVLILSEQFRGKAVEKLDSKD